MHNKKNKNNEYNCSDEDYDNYWVTDEKIIELEYYYGYNEYDYILNDW